MEQALFDERRAVTSDGSIQKFKNGKLLQAGSRVAPDQVLWPSVYQTWSKDKVNYSNEYLTNPLRI